MATGVGLQQVVNDKLFLRPIQVGLMMMMMMMIQVGPMMPGTDLHQWARRPSMQPPGVRVFTSGCYMTSVAIIGCHWLPLVAI